MPKIFLDRGGEHHWRREEVRCKFKMYSSKLLPEYRWFVIEQSPDWWNISDVFESSNAYTVRARKLKALSYVSPMCTCKLMGFFYCWNYNIGSKVIVIQKGVWLMGGVKIWLKWAQEGSLTNKGFLYSYVLSCYAYIMA